MLDFLSFCTVPIEIRNEQGRTVTKATSYFHSRNEENAYLVTNWHVVTDRLPSVPSRSRSGALPTEAVLYLHKKQKDKSSIRTDDIVSLKVPLNDADGNSPKWLEHPTLKNRFDVVALPINIKILDGAVFNCISDWPGNYSNLEPYAMADVAIVGYPWGLTGGGNLPLFKRGGIASEPDVNQNGLPRFLIDSRTTEGNSGSPVICSHSGIYTPGNVANLQNDSVIGTVRRFIGVYSGRLESIEEGDSTKGIENISEIGIAWKVSEVEHLISNGVAGTTLNEITSSN